MSQKQLWGFMSERAGAVCFPSAVPLLSSLVSRTFLSTLTLATSVAGRHQLTEKEPIKSHFSKQRLSHFSFWMVLAGVVGCLHMTDTIVSSLTAFFSHFPSSRLTFDLPHSIPVLNYNTVF